MLFISSFAEVEDVIELNLMQLRTEVSDRHLERITVTNNSCVRRLGTCARRVAGHHLAIDPLTSSWALLTPREAMYYSTFDPAAFAPVSDDFLGIAGADCIAFVRSLYRRGLVAVDGIFPYAQDIYSKSVPFHEVPVVELLMTERCNLKCCYCQADARSTGVDMPRHIAEAAINRAFRLPYPTVFFELSGGELLLNKALLKDVVSLIEGEARRSQKDTLVNIVTNGTLIDSDLIAFIKTHAIKLTVSVDGPADAHDRARPFTSGKGSWTLVDRSLRRLKDSDVHFGVVLTVSRHNVSKAEDICEFLNNLQPNSIKINPVMRVGRAVYNPSSTITAEEYLQFMQRIMTCLMSGQAVIREFILSEVVHRLISKFRDYRCMRGNCNAGATYFVIDPRGYVFPCAAITRQHAVLGHVNDSMCALELLANRVDYLRRFTSRHPCSAQQCQDCSWRHFCLGGCALQALEEPSLDFSSVLDPNCCFFRGMYSFLLESLSTSPHDFERYLQSESFAYGPAWTRDEQLI